MTDNLRQAAGSLLVVGLGGTELTGLERAWLKLVRPGGIILFKRNIADAAGTRALLDDATGLGEATGLGARHGIRCVDVEGGAVNRLRDALAPLPSAQAVAAAARKLGKAALAREHGELIARAVKAFGFNSTLAPVVDLALPEAAEVLGSRAPGATAQEVIAYARPYLAALAANGVIGCGKHFPGLGGASSDTHFVTPEISRAWQQIWNEDLVPYRELHEAMPMIMVNHAAYLHTPGATPGNNRPASASSFWITTILRRRMGYRGIILSDDLEMGGMLKFLSIEQAAVAAVAAGIDLVEICHSAELILRSYEALIAEAERSAAFRKLLLGRARTVARQKRRLFTGGQGAKGAARALSSKQLDALRSQMLRFRDRIAASESDVTNPRAAAPAEIA